MLAVVPAAVVPRPVIGVVPASMPLPPAVNPVVPVAKLELKAAVFIVPAKAVPPATVPPAVKAVPPATAPPPAKAVPAAVVPPPAARTPLPPAVNPAVVVVRPEPAARAVAFVAAAVAAVPPVTILPTTVAAFDANPDIELLIDENTLLNIELIDEPIPLKVLVKMSAIFDAAQSAIICRIMFLKVLARLSNASRPFSNKSIKKPDIFVFICSYALAASSATRFASVSIAF